MDDLDYVDVEGDSSAFNQIVDLKIRRPRGRPRKKTAPSLEEGIIRIYFKIH